MRNVVLLIIGFQTGLFVMAQDKSASKQKPPVSFDSEEWPYLDGSPIISGNGNYVLYKIGNKPEGGSTLVVRNIRRPWTREIAGATDGFFSANNQKVVFYRNDTLFFLSVATGHMTEVAGVSSYKQPMNHQGEWLAYHLKGPRKQCVLENLVTGATQYFDSVVSFSFEPRGRVLLVITKKMQSDKIVTVLNWVDLRGGEQHSIWSDTASAQVFGTVDQPCFEDSGRQLVFRVGNKEGQQPLYSLWYFKEGREKAQVLVNDGSPALGFNFIYPYTQLQFSKNGRHIIFQLQEPERQKPSPNAVQVDVWSYKDSVLQSTQLLDLKNPNLFYMAIDPDSGQLIQITDKDDYFNSKAYAPENFVIVSDRQSIARQNQYWWQPQPSHYLVSLNDGSRKLLTTGFSAYDYSFSFSPGGKYLIYYDHAEQHYLSYNLQSGRRTDISGAVQERLSTEYITGGLPGHADPPIGIAGWLAHDSALLVYDEYDIWQLDPRGLVSPVNITNGYGRRHHIRFRLVEEAKAQEEGLSVHASLILTALNTENKYNGFYRKKLEKKADPELLFIGPYKFYLTESQKMGSGGGLGMKPVRAREAEAWVIERQSASEAPNYFWTKDFKTYTPLSVLQPQAACNWLTSELVTWKLPNGTSSQGILYKPSDFDHRKKYPLIFNYYQERSCELFDFPAEPTGISADINIPWFVSRGYLVFVPDIHFEVGNTSQSVVNSVVSAAQYLSQFPFVDSMRMGITGHSFGGSETNYLVTHTHLFTAAVEASGGSDLISGYLGLASDRFGSISRMGLQESGQGRLGATLWQLPDSILLNTPVLRADQVTTPLLMMHNKKDPSVPFEQAIEFFSALRRLGKKVWLLQYDRGKHGLFDDDAHDYITRITQFFDYYLKNSTPPLWMTQGIPAARKGIDTGLELDRLGRKP